jgi:hypothetical protein
MTWWWVALGLVLSAFGFWRWREARIRRLNWPRKMSPVRFGNMISRYLVRNGWDVEMRENKRTEAPDEMIIRKLGAEVVLWCRSPGFSIGPTYAARALRTGTDERWPVIIVHADELSASERTIVLETQLQVIHYKDLGQIEEIVRTSSQRKKELRLRRH